MYRYHGPPERRGKKQGKGRTMVKSFFRGMLCAALALGILFAPPAGRAEETDLRTLQARLIFLGYEIGKADGVMGPKTSAAVLLAETLLAEAGYGVIPDGIPEPETAALILEEKTADLLRKLIRGSRGSRVREAQKKLNELNLLRESADGVYGANTEAAVQSFEERMNALRPGSCEADGRLAADEYGLLMGDLSVYGFEAPPYFDETHPEQLKETDLYARNACLINAVTGETLFEKAADERAEPASTTKIVTLLTALSMCDPEQEVVIPEAAADVPADSTLVPVVPGERMTMNDLLHGMMIRSGNDAANAVAVLCAGSMEAFTEEMNRTAAELGMTGSHFVNPHGYTAEGHYTTARDLTTAARSGMTQMPFIRIVTCLRYTLPATEKRDALPIANKWELFDPASEYYIPHAAGVKSGYTSSAGFCYVGAYQENGVTLIAAVMGGRYRNQAWTDLRRLFAYGMAAAEKEKTE